MPAIPSHRRRLLLLGAAAALAACTTQEQSPAAGDASASGAPAGGAAGSAGGEQTPDPGGKVITVQMLTDDQGNNVFQPADFEASRGDVIRYTLQTGAHNVHFVADSNRGKSGLPPASEILQLPGQTYDLKVTLAPGTYYYQCDPHALIGMIGHLTVK